MYIYIFNIKYDRCSNNKTNKHNWYEFKQSKYEHVPKLQFRSTIVASSTKGKTVLVQNLILNVYRNSFARIFIFSPGVHKDPTFTEVKKYIRDELHVDDE